MAGEWCMKGRKMRETGGVMRGKGFLMNRSPLSSGFWCGGGRVWSLDVGEI